VFRNFSGQAARSVRALFVSTLITASVSAVAANLQIVPTTTRTAQTSNNTSAPDAINSSTRGYAASGSISKLPIKSLLYPGATPRIFAALMGWFGKASHLGVGYNSQDAAQVKKQVEDMQSRGIDGAIIAWYGQGSYEDRTALALKTQAEAHPNFSFFLMIDQGTIQWNAQGMAPTDAMIYHLNYMAQTYYSSPAYERINGRPVVREFGTEAWPIDWVRVLASVQGNPVIIFRNPPAFTNANAFGGYGWGPAEGIAYTDYFNKIANQHKDKIVMADGWKGFNDVLASWTANRVVDQQCGQTWMNSMAELGKYYSATNPLPYLQIATWNDYEEGTTIESGIDNCVTVNAATSGTQLQWTLGGAGLENTLDHYSVFISTDGENLMPLADVPTGTYSLNLSRFNLAAGSYTLYVKAVAKASMKNQMSNAATFWQANAAPSVSLNATPVSGASGMTVTAQMTATDADGSVASSQIDFGDGTIIAAASGSHVYARPGTFTITARATDNIGASGTATQSVTVTNQAPHIALSATPITGNYQTTITASTAGSTDADGSIASASINFGDGTVSATSPASHVYAHPGTYTITATVTDDLGATASATRLVTISNQSPSVVLNVTPSSGNIQTTVTASTAGSTDADGLIVATLIDFGDGTRATTASASHVYARVGTYTVAATVTDDLGASTTATRTVSIANQAPTAVLTTTPNTGYAPTMVSASTAGSSDADGTITATTIDFGDGTVIAGATATHNYANVGTYTVTARVTDNLGATSIATKTVTIAPAAVTIFLPATQPNAATPLNVKASAVSGLPITGMWVYLDNVGLYGNHAGSLDIFISVKAGTHVLQVKAWDNTGHITSSSVTLNVAAASIAPRTSRGTPTTTTTGTATAARLAVTTDSVATTSTPIEPRAARLGR
jgi:PKD repeat protein